MRSNLACAYEAAGDSSRAIPLFEGALAGRVRLLGDDHPQTLSSLNDLAHAHYVVGDLACAIALYERALADCERVLGPQHPATATVRANLDIARQTR